MANYDVRSNFGSRYFLEDPSGTNGILNTDGTGFKSNAQTTAANELKDCLDSTLGAINKDVKTFKTLNGDGWDSAVPLGQSYETGTMNFIRTGSGTYIVPGANSNPDTIGTDTFSRLQKWMLDSSKAGGSIAEKVIVEIVPRSETTYDCMAWRVVPTAFDRGAKNTTDGQEFSITVQPYGAPIVGIAGSTNTEGVFTLTNPTFAS